MFWITELKSMQLNVSFYEGKIMKRVIRKFMVAFVTLSLCFSSISLARETGYLTFEVDGMMFTSSQYLSQDYYCEKSYENENIIIEIKKVLYSYHSLDDLEFANRYLCHWIARSIISRGKVLNEVGVRFTDEICDNLSIAPKQFRFFLPPEAMNVCDLFWIYI